MTTANHDDPVVQLRTFKFAAAYICEEVLCWLRPQIKTLGGNICDVFVNEMKYLSCHPRAGGAGASPLPVQPLHPGVQPASSPICGSGEERLAAETH